VHVCHWGQRLFSTSCYSVLVWQPLPVYSHTNLLYWYFCLCWWHVIQMKWNVMCWERGDAFVCCKRVFGIGTWWCLHSIWPELCQQDSQAVSDSKWVHHLLFALCEPVIADVHIYLYSTNLSMSVDLFIHALPHYQTP